MFAKLLNKSVFSLFVFSFGCITATAQYVYSPAGLENASESVVTIMLASDGESHAVGSGLIVRSDGHIMTPFSLVRGAREIQVRLRNGETYDKAEIVSTDERRNISILKINAAGLRIIPNGTAEETQVGSRVFLFANPDGKFVSKNDLSLTSVQMADNIQGAGKGYRLLQIDSTVTGNTAGALLLDERGYSLGMVTTTPGMKGQIAVPLSSVVGLIRSVSTNAVAAAAPVSNPAVSQTPVPIPQNSVLVPQRGITPLSAKGPGSVVVKPSTVPEILAASKTIYVTSRSISFKPDQLVNALNSRKEMSEWGLSFVDEQELADLILEVDHVLYTWKYTFKLYSQRLGTVVATGSRIIWDGNLGAPYMADRFIEKIKIARGPEKTNQAKRPDSKTEAEIRKLFRDSRSDDTKTESTAEAELEKLDKSYLPILRTILSKGKPCERVEAAGVYLDLNGNDNREIVPILVELTTGGNILSLFNLQEEFMCRRSAAYLLPYSAEGVRALTKLLKDGDTWEKQTAIFAFDDFTEVYDYDNPAMDEAIKDAIPVMGKGVKAKDKVISDMSNEVLGQIFRRCTPKLKALAEQYYEK